jgi:hypothetical protein
MKIKQVWIPYHLWEDYINGMWRKVENKDHFLSLAVKFTGNHVLYGQAMREVIFAWPKTMINSLTNPSLNHLAFVGHCACCFKHNFPESIVRQAWGLLSDEQRFLADREAEKAVNHWKEVYKSKFQLLLFDADNY